MAVTAYKQGNWRVVFDDGSSIVVIIGDNDYIIGIVNNDTKRILVHETIIQFDKNIIQIEEV